MTRSTSFAITLFSIVLIVSPWMKAHAEIQLPMPSNGGLLSNEGSLDGSPVAIPPPQPQCWVEALKIFQPKNNYEMETTSKVCERMGPQHQKALAFELARCHLEDLGRDIMVVTSTSKAGDSEHEGNTIEDPQQCTILSSVTAKDDPHFPNLSRCLSHLSESGTNAYTLFFAQVVQLCNRLTQHMAIDFQQHTAMQLAKISQQAVNQITDILHNQHEAFRKREDEMRLRHESFYAAIQEQQEKLWEGQTSRFHEFKAWTASLMEHWKVQAQEQKQQYEAWFANQTNNLEDRANEIERLQLDKIVGAIEFLQPLITLETWLVIAKHGYDLIVFTLWFTMAINVVWLVTRPRRCRRSRRCLLGLTILEGAVELFTAYVVHKGFFSESQQSAMLSSLRQTALCLASLVYMVGLFVSCCDFDGDNEDDYDEDYEYGDSNEEEEAADTPSQQQQSEDLQVYTGSASLGGQAISGTPRGAVPLEEVNFKNPERPLMGRVLSSDLHSVTSGVGSKIGFASVVSPGLDEAATGSDLKEDHRKKPMETRVIPQMSDGTSTARRLAFGDKPMETTTSLQNSGVSASVAAASGRNSTGNLDDKESALMEEMEPSSLKMAPGTARHPQIPQWRNKKRSSEEMTGDVLETDMHDDDLEDDESSRQVAKRRRVEEEANVSANAAAKPSMMDMDDSDDDEGYHTAKEEEQQQHAKEDEEKWANEHSTDDEDEDEGDDHEIEDEEEGEKEEEDDDVSMVEEDNQPADDEAEEVENMDSTSAEHME